MCGVCGFSLLKGEEWKMMGLSAYGKHDDRIYDLMRNVVQVKGGEIVNGKDWRRCERELFAMTRDPAESPLASADVAYAAQEIFTNSMLEVLEYLHGRGLSDNLVLGGGCGLNSAFNGKALEASSFVRLYVFCAPADDGNAVGAALLAHHEDRPSSYRPTEIQSPYLGTPVSKSGLEKLLRHGHLQGRQFASTSLLCAHTAELLSGGKVGR